MNRNNRTHAGRLTGHLMAALAATLILGGCVIHEHAPPPYAPAHGYRYVDPYGVQLVFDSRIGVYSVVGHPGYYYYDNLYWRRPHGYWEHSSRVDGRWYHQSRAPRPLPPGVAKKYGPPPPHRY